jgi:hypothetical protein
MKLVRLFKMCLNDMHSKVCICKHLADNFSIQNVLKYVDVVLPLLFNLALGYPIRKVQETQMGLKLNSAAILSRIFFLLIYCLST